MRNLDWRSPNIAFGFFSLSVWGGVIWTLVLGWQWTDEVVAQWVQAIGTIVAIWYAGKRGRDQIRSERDRRAEQQADQLASIVRALYIEVYSRAVRCARDCHTWIEEIRLENERGSGKKDVPKRRDGIDLLKFTPTSPVVYPTLGEFHGRLPAEAEATLNEFYYRLNMIQTDVKRFSRNPPDRELGLRETKHVAEVFWRALKPGKEALTVLRRQIADVTELDAKLDHAYRDMLLMPYPIGSNAFEGIDNIITEGHSAWGKHGS